mmetsp:Transcript_2947/g.5530  ORF Transcript_2947/g.5530 Transcript_2947/m.5530 type:complete len:86 (+) Transcript_2947:62-319(+)
MKLLQFFIVISLSSNWVTSQDIDLDKSQDIHPGRFNEKRWAKLAQRGRSSDVSNKDVEFRRYITSITIYDISVAVTHRIIGCDIR